ncbi:Uncharacterized lipoprotein YgeR [Burkholderia diffusa]|uniref:peptidoglycan DD-metalloendopeptidase family protein n=1 Tax=Burkholderia diffusa TaxID=488732 RepID=UPI001CAAE687|nr:peptidoglycan DD-metalloendopeptidase family protein [Burkholderia diffusa]CAG9258431.1 Uncharacterized lipoprotein YgeR [Burkholderia diffusa]
MLGTTTKQFTAASFAALLAGCGSAPADLGYYRVERGDTLSTIARSNHQPIKNIMRWNQITTPDAIEVGQVLRVEPPPGATMSGSNPAASTIKPPSAITLIWPTAGETIRAFDGADSLGIDIANNAGTLVVAAAPGVVVYAGNELRGYGNLIVIKHNADYLTAYAHNRALLIKEGQLVAQGQAIAEMGDTDNDRVALHFEVRWDGHSVDPSSYLPTR